MAKPRIKLPSQAAPGEVITIKTLISHKMESGQRKGSDGKLVPRMIINSFTCTFNGQPVFSCDIGPAISANPYLQFNAKVQESGEFEFTWVEDTGEVFTAKEKIQVG